MEHLFGLASKCRCWINRRYKTFVGTLHCALENGADLYVNERQKIRHFRDRSAEERKRRKNAKSRFFYFARCIRKLALYSHVIILIRLQISRRTRWWCLKCVIVYLARDIPTFVMYCVIVYLARDIPTFVMYCIYGTSRSSLLIESTDSICIIM